jgi:hypothetical protein
MMTSGGEIIQSYPFSPIAPNDLQNFQHIHLGLELDDVYAGTSAWAEIGEAMVVPEPASLTLLFLAGAAVLRRRR